MFQSAGIGGQAGPAGEPLVEVKAGQMTTEGKKVIPDRRRGKIKVVKDVQGIISFQWMDMGASQPETTLTIFPGDAKFVKVK